MKDVELDAGLESEIDAARGQLASRQGAAAGLCDGDGCVRSGHAAGRPLLSRTLTRWRAACGDAVRRPLREVVAGYDAADRRDAERAQRGACVPRARGCTRSRHRRGEPELRRTRAPRPRRESPACHARRAGVAVAALSAGAARALQREVPACVATALSAVRAHRAGLPRAALRVLQAEGYLPQRNPSRSPAGSDPYAQALAGTPQADAAR